jgi:hypothetical protein
MPQKIRDVESRMFCAYTKYSPISKSSKNQKVFIHPIGATVSYANTPYIMLISTSDAAKKLLVCVPHTFMLILSKTHLEALIVCSTQP